MSGIEFLDKGKYSTEIKAAAARDEAGYVIDDFDARAKSIVDMLTQKHKKRTDGKNKVYVIVSHAPVVYRA